MLPPGIFNFILERSVAFYIILNVHVNSFSKHINCSAAGNINFTAILRLRSEHNIGRRPCDLILNYEMLV